MPQLVDCCQHATANTNSTRLPDTSAVHHATTASNHKVLSRIQEHLNQATNQLQNIRNGQATFNKFTNHIVTTTKKHPYNSPQHLISPHITKFLPQGNKALQSQLTTIFNHGIWITYHIFFLQFSTHIYS